jgi:hypothetical protein
VQRFDRLHAEQQESTAFSVGCNGFDLTCGAKAQDCKGSRT